MGAMMTPALIQSSPGAADDAELVRRIAARDASAFETLMRRYNRRLFRVARAILRSDDDAEDALQEAYVAAWRNIAGFRGAAQLSTWLTRIVVNEAYARLRRASRARVVPLGEGPDMNEPADAEAHGGADADPEAAAMQTEMRRLLERHIDALPEQFRTAFMLREVEELSVEEAAACLDVPEATVRSRTFRARALARVPREGRRHGDAGGLRLRGRALRSHRRRGARAPRRRANSINERGIEMKRMIVATVLLLGVGSAWAQEGAPNDAQIAQIVVTANQVDIDAGKLAQTKASNAEVKKFAEQMIADHTAVNKQAKDLVTKLKVKPEDNATARSLAQGGRDNLANLRGLKKGRDFDKTYVDHEVAYHQAVLDALDKTLVPNTKNEELKALLVKVRPAFVAHLEHAKHIQGTLGK
jgi:putative membrane protein